MAEKKISSWKFGVLGPTLAVIFGTILMMFGIFLISINLKFRKILAVLLINKKKVRK